VIIIAEIILRKYTENDSAILEEMTKNSYNKEYLDDDRFTYITIAAYEGIVAGFSYACIYYGESRIFVYVLPKYRRRGIGTALYNKAEKEAREANCRGVWSTYYNRTESDDFVNKVGVTQIKGNDFMKYDGDILPEKDYLIRTYKAADFDEYNYITSRAWHELRVRTGEPDSKIIEPPEEERLRSCDDDTCYVLEDGGRIVGGGSFFCDNDGKYHIDAICVDVQLYNRGYGRALAVFLTNEILRRGNNAAYLSVEHGNHNARYIYESIGYTTLYTGYSPIKKL